MNTSSLSRFPSDGRFLPPVVGHSLGDISGAVFHDSANERARAIRNATAPTYSLTAASSPSPSMPQRPEARTLLPPCCSIRAVAAGFVSSAAISSWLVTTRAHTRASSAAVVGNYFFVIRERR